MKYMLLIYGDESRLERIRETDMQELMGAYFAYTKALQGEGAYVAGDRLGPSATATTVRKRDGRAQVLNGPYAETKEQLGGYYIIEAPDLDEAMQWAAKCPGAEYGTIELRPFFWQGGERPAG